MIRYLLFNAKLKMMKTGETQGVELCDTYVLLIACGRFYYSFDTLNECCRMSARTLLKMAAVDF